MSTHFHHVRDGSAFGIRYRFDMAGEGVPMHRHDASTEHSVHCERGSVKVYGHTWREVVPAGATLAFDSRQPHEIAALEAGTVIFNQFKNGMPPEYAQLPAHELDGELELTLEGDPNE
jgi:quercetin dioxygenase-like cupin family protein